MIVCKETLFLWQQLFAISAKGDMPFKLSVNSTTFNLHQEKENSLSLCINVYINTLQKS